MRFKCLWVETLEHIMSSLMSLPFRRRLYCILYQLLVQVVASILNLYGLFSVIPFIVRLLRCVYICTVCVYIFSVVLALSSILPHSLHLYLIMFCCLVIAQCHYRRIYSFRPVFFPYILTVLLPYRPHPVAAFILASTVFCFEVSTFITLRRHSKHLPWSLCLYLCLLFQFSRLQSIVLKAFVIRCVYDCFSSQFILLQSIISFRSSSVIYSLVLKASFIRCVYYFSFFFSPLFLVALIFLCVVFCPLFFPPF